MTKKTVLITGASSGIGFQLAKIFAKKGHDLVLIARSEKKLKELKKEIEEKFQVTVFLIIKDLSKIDSALEIYDEIKSKNIKIDYLINNAGIGDYGYFYESDWQKQLIMINLNITTLSYMTRLFLEDMVKNKKGKIMNLASTAAFQPGPKMSVYYASKAYVLSFSQAINNEVKDKNITVTALCPGPTKSNFQEKADLKKVKFFNSKSLPSSKDVAEYGYKAMIKGKTVAIHGYKNKLLSKMVVFLPQKLVLSIVRKLQDK